MVLLFHVNVFYVCFIAVIIPAKGLQLNKEYQDD